MKIGIITFSDRNNMPYLKYYEDIIQKANIAYECVFWDRFANSKTTKKGNEYTLHIKCLSGANKFGKILPMLKYKYIVEKVIKKEQYTHLIILTTLPGVLLNKILLKEFKNKYILDIRDYTYEKYGFYKKIVDELVDKSYFAAISSKGFMKFLNETNKIIPCHNISNAEDAIDDCNDIKNKKQITIGFLGNIRYFDENCNLINALANNFRYKLVYAGINNADCDLEGYCKKHNIKNVYFYGKYENKDKLNLYKNIDLINSVYGNKGLEVTTLLPNRLYDGLLLKKPILASNGTYLGRVVKQNNIGLNLDLGENGIEKEIEQYILSFNKDDFTKSCQNLLFEISNEQNYFCKKIQNFVLKVN